MKAIELIDFQLSPLLVVMVSCKARTFHSIPSYPMSPNAHPLCLSLSLFLPIAGHTMVRLYMGAKWCFRRGACPGSPARQAEGGNCDSGAHGHAEEGADIPGLRTGPFGGARAEAQVTGQCEK